MQRMLMLVGYRLWKTLIWLPVSASELFDDDIGDDFGKELLVLVAVYVTIELGLLLCFALNPIRHEQISLLWQVVIWRGISLVVYMLYGMAVRASLRPWGFLT